MKTAERHQLKSNEVAEQLAHASAWLSGRSRELGWAIGAVVLVLAVAGGWYAWRERSRDQAGALLADAVTVAEAPVVAAPAPGSNAPAAAPGSYPTEKARSEAALAKFQEVASKYPSTPAGLAARYQAAALLSDLGRTQEAEQQFRDIMAQDGGIYGRTARLGLAGLQVKRGKYDEAIATYRDLVARKDSDIPTDAVLMQLGRAYEAAGKRAEALQSFQRILDEFPQSAYQGEARRAVDTLKQAS